MPCLKSPNVKNETSYTNEKHVASRKNILSIYLCNHLFGYDVYALLLMRGCLCKRRRNYPRVYNYCIKKYLPNVWTNMIEWNQLCRVGGVLYAICFMNLTNMACQNQCLLDLLYCVYLCPKLYINTRLICTYIYADEPSFLISNRYSPFAPNTTHWRLKRYFYENWWGKDDESWLNLFDLDTQTLQKISNYILDYENRNI